MSLIKIIAFTLISILAPDLNAQTDKQINQTDSNGRKQGRWIKHYPNGNIMYDGSFTDDKPGGEFKRYYENKSLKSIMVFNKSGTEAEATLYYPNGLPASKGKYINQMKEGKWQFFSFTTKGLLVSEETYSKDKVNGTSVKYYPDSTIAEKLDYTDGIRHGEWIKYYPDGKITFKTTFRKGKLNGSFNAYFENGKPEFTGKYVDDFRDGTWMIYRKDGSLRFKTEYIMGTPDNREMEIYETNYLDSIEQIKVKIPDPEKTGNIW